MSNRYTIELDGLYEFHYIADRDHPNIKTIGDMDSHCEALNKIEKLQKQNESLIHLVGRSIILLNDSEQRRGRQEEIESICKEAREALKQIKEMK